MRIRPLILCALIALLAVPARAHINRMVATDRPACLDTTPPYALWLTGETDSTDCDATAGGTAEALCLCQNGAWVAVAAGGGSGDITDVQSCTTGNCSAITAAAGDSLDESSADSTVPWKVNTTAAPTTEGAAIWESDVDRLQVGDGATTKTFYPGSEISAVLDLIGSTRGSILYRGAAAWSALTPGTTDYPLVSNGAGADPAYEQLAAGGLASDAVTEAKLKAVNGATDEYILTYESTTGDFEWEAMSTQVTDDVAPYGQYDSSNPPASCATCDESTDDTPSLTWEWGNQDSATLTQTMDTFLLVGDTTDEYHYRWTDPPSSGNIDMTINGLLRINAAATATGDGCGIGILHAGTVATPTQITHLYWTNAATDGYYFQSDTDYNPAAGVTNHSSIGASLTEASWRLLFFQIRYTDSTRAVTAHVSADKDFSYYALSAGTTLAADPIKVGFFARRAGICSFEAIRVRTDASRNFAGE